jgi:hypothetical protein
MDGSRVLVPCFVPICRRQIGKACEARLPFDMLCPAAFGVRVQSMAPLRAPAAEWVKASHPLFMGSFVSDEREAYAEPVLEARTP